MQLSLWPLVYAVFLWWFSTGLILYQDNRSWENSMLDLKFHIIQSIIVQIDVCCCTIAVQHNICRVRINNLCSGLFRH